MGVSSPNEPPQPQGSFQRSFCGFRLFASVSALRPVGQSGAAEAEGLEAGTARVHMLWPCSDEAMGGTVHIEDVFRRFLRRERLCGR